MAPDRRSLPMPRLEAPALAGHPLRERPIEALPAPYSDMDTTADRRLPCFGPRGPCAAGSGCFHDPRWPRFGRSWPDRLGPDPDLAGRAGDRRTLAGGGGPGAGGASRLGNYVGASRRRWLSRSAIFAVNCSMTSGASSYIDRSSCPSMVAAA